MVEPALPPSGGPSHGPSSPSSLLLSLLLQLAGRGLGLTASSRVSREEGNDTLRLVSPSASTRAFFRDRRFMRGVWGVNLGVSGTIKAATSPPVMFPN